MKKLVSRLAMFALLLSALGLVGSSSANAGSYVFQATCGGVGLSSEPFIVNNATYDWPAQTPHTYYRWGQECDDSIPGQGIKAGDGFTGSLVLGDKTSMRYDLGAGARFTKINSMVILSDGTLSAPGIQTFSYGVRVEAGNLYFPLAGLGLSDPSPTITNLDIPAEGQGPILRAFIECKRASCSGGADESHVQFRSRPKLTIEDFTPPIAVATGNILSSSPVSGVRSLGPLALDGESGISALVGTVNNQLVFSESPACDTSAGQASKLKPCPRTVTPSINVDTTAAPWVEGVNTLRMCATDYATIGAPNLYCMPPQNIVVDN